MDSKGFAIPAMAVLTLISLLLVSSVSAVEAPPPIPCDYQGTLTIGGVLPPSVPSSRPGFMELCGVRR